VTDLFRARSFGVENGGARVAILTVLVLHALFFPVFRTCRARAAWVVAMASAPDVASIRGD